MRDRLCMWLWLFRERGQTFWAWLWRVRILSPVVYRRFMNYWDALFPEGLMRRGCDAWYTRQG